MKVSAEESRKTHDRIVDMAAKLFLESGFEAVSLSDIMSATGQTNGGFYKRFSSKDDLAEQAKPCRRICHTRGQKPTLGWQLD